MFLLLKIIGVVLLVNILIELIDEGKIKDYREKISIQYWEKHIDRLVYFLTKMYNAW